MPRQHAGRFLRLASATEHLVLASLQRLLRDQAPAVRTSAIRTLARLACALGRAPSVRAALSISPMVNDDMAEVRQEAEAALQALSSGTAPGTDQPSLPGEGFGPSLADDIIRESLEDLLALTASPDPATRLAAIEGLDSLMPDTPPTTDDVAF
jgi:hypothetical protein